MVERLIHTVWCDDIRREVGNKLSFMGVYTGTLVLPMLPVVLPRLSAHCWIVTPKEHPFKALGVKVLKNGKEVLVEFSVKQEHLVDEAEDLKNSTKRVAMVGFTMDSLQMSPDFEFISCVAVTEDGEMEGPRLHVQVNPTAISEQNQLTTSVPSSNF